MLYVPCRTMLQRHWKVLEEHWSCQRTPTRSWFLHTSSSQLSGSICKYIWVRKMQGVTYNFTLTKELIYDQTTYIMDVRHDWNLIQDKIESLNWPEHSGWLHSWRQSAGSCKWSPRCTDRTTTRTLPTWQGFLKRKCQVSSCRWSPQCTGETTQVHGNLCRGS